jgi:iron complex outermembrane recepter protein
VLTYFSDQYMRGGESNQNKPLAGYTVVNLHASYKIGDHAELFANITNLLDTKYATFGAYGDPTGVGAPGIPAGATTNAPGVDNRFFGPGAPLAMFAACGSSSEKTGKGNERQSAPTEPEIWG